MTYNIHYLDLTTFEDKIFQSKDDSQIKDFIMNCSTISVIFKLVNGKERVQKKYKY